MNPPRTLRIAVSGAALREAVSCRRSLVPAGLGRLAIP